MYVHRRGGRAGDSAPARRDLGEKEGGEGERGILVGEGWAAPGEDLGEELIWEGGEKLAESVVIVVDVLRGGGSASLSARFEEGTEEGVDLVWVVSMGEVVVVAIVD